MPWPTLTIVLSPTERALLAAGVVEWDGPSRATEELAQAMGFQSVVDLIDDGRRISEAIKADAPISRLDWERALVALEINWASQRFGFGRDWEMLVGFSDTMTFELLRDIQPAMRSALRHVDWPGIGTQPAKDPSGMGLLRPDKPGAGG